MRDRRVVVSPAVAAGGIGHAEAFPSFIRRLKPAAAINGTFFSKETLRPIGDIVLDAELVHFGGMGTAIAFARDGVDIIRLPMSRHVDWSEHRAALAAGPLLVWNGFAKPRPGGEGFGDPSVFARAAPRSAVGVTADNRLLLVTTARGTSLGRLAAALRDLGAAYAVNLDGGGSAAMWCRGRMVKSPRRPLTNILAVYVKPAPVSGAPLRPPRGLDWRGGHPPRPVLRLSADGVSVSVTLPRYWEDGETVLLEGEWELPEGWRVVVLLDESPVLITTRLPVEMALVLSPLERPKHSFWVRVRDAEGQAVAGEERIFRIGEPAG